MANFIVCGLLVLGFAVGLRRVLVGARASVAAPVLLGGFAVALLVAGVFVTDPALGYPPGAQVVFSLLPPPLAGWRVFEVSAGYSVIW